MKEYKRLTEVKEINKYCSTVECGEHCEDCYVGKLYERLAELEDKIENGTLIELPCKVGDTVWVITECYNNIKGKNNYFINKRNIETIEFNERCMLILCNDGGHYILGRRTFLTREEAEAKLKELQEKENER